MMTEKVYDDDAVTGLLYRPNTRQLIIYPDYFMNLRMFVSSDKEFYEMAEIELKELKKEEEECVKRLKVFLTRDKV